MHSLKKDCQRSYCYIDDLVHQFESAISTEDYLSVDDDHGTSLCLEESANWREELRDEKLEKVMMMIMTLKTLLRN